MTTEINPDEESAVSYAAEAQHAVEVLAEEMKSLADRLALVAQQFTATGRSATAVAADIVSDFTQGTGGTMGARLWTVVHNAGKADEHRSVVKLARVT